MSGVSKDANKGHMTLEQLRSKRPESTGKKPKKQESWWRSILVALVIALVIRTFFVEAFHIPSGSMKNTLLVGDFLFVNKVSYFFRTPKYIPLTTIEIPHFSIPTGSIHHGDVIVFEYPGDRDLVAPREKKVNYIKRCIGLPGDSIQIINKQVYVNGAEMQNPPEYQIRQQLYKKGDVDMHIFPKDAPWNTDQYGPLRVPKTGDTVHLNPTNAAGWEVFIAREGHVVHVAPNGTVIIDDKPSTVYVVQRDYLFMMGDNRDDSEDSRIWGFAPVENVVGGALFIYWSAYGSFGTPEKDPNNGYDQDEPDQSFHIRWNRIFRGIH